MMNQLLNVRFYLVLSIAAALAPGAVVAEELKVKLDAEGTSAAISSDAAPGATDTPPADLPEEKEEDFAPTHKQTGVMSINQEGLAKAELVSFAMMPTGHVLAACTVGEAGEVRRFSPTGEYDGSWSLPIAPEAIGVGSDGFVYAAGGGKLLKLDAEGAVVLEADAPHAVELLNRKDEIKQQIIEQGERIKEMLGRSLESSKKRIADGKVKIKDLHAELDEHADALAGSVVDGAELEDADMKAKLAEMSKLMKRLASEQKRLGIFERSLESTRRSIERRSTQEMTDEDWEERIQKTIAVKTKVSSISEHDGSVFVATRSAGSTGYAVWRLASDMKGGRTIVDELRGCCGQMDVQAGPDGVFVAENSRHRVLCVGADGKEVCEWGGRAREGVKGFNGCCNPMNVAFGADGSVYTAESTIGRIKRFDAQGNLLGLVGSVELVPGCKKVSIAVGPSGDRIYMLDITRHHIVVMERVAEQPAPSTEASTGASTGASTDTAKGQEV